MRRRDFMLTGAASVACAHGARAADARPFMSLSYSPSGVDLEGELARGIEETRIRLSALSTSERADLLSDLVGVRANRRRPPVIASPFILTAAVPR